MPSTAKLLSASGTKVHAFIPGENTTLCGLAVEIDDEEIKRFYNGIHRKVCRRCATGAIKARQVGTGMVALPLQVLRSNL